MQVADAFACTSHVGFDWTDIERRRITMLRRAYALECLESALKERNTPELSGLIMQTKVEAGELLWQGKYGFCVAASSCKREGNGNCEVLLLQRGEKRKYFRATLLIPVIELLDKGVISESAISEPARAELLAMLGQVGNGFRQLFVATK